MKNSPISASMAQRSSRLITFKICCTPFLISNCSPFHLYIPKPLSLMEMVSLFLKGMEACIPSVKCHAISLMDLRRWDASKYSNSGTGSFPSLSVNLCAKYSPKLGGSVTVFLFTLSRTTSSTAPRNGFFFCKSERSCLNISSISTTEYSFVSLFTEEPKGLGFAGSVILSSIVGLFLQNHEAPLWDI